MKIYYIGVGTNPGIVVNILNHNARSSAMTLNPLSSSPWSGNSRHFPASPVTGPRPPPLPSVPTDFRCSYGEFMSMFAKTVAERTRPGVRQDIEERNNTFHVYGSTAGVAGVIISDGEYPAMVAHQLLSKIVDEFTTANPRSSYSSTSVTKIPYPQLKDYIVKYQDPNQADSIMKVQRELDETKIVLHKTIESVLERGEKIDSLVQKSVGDPSCRVQRRYTNQSAGRSFCFV